MIRHRVLDQAGAHHVGRRARVGALGQLVEQHAIGQQQRLDLAQRLLHARQRRQRRAQAGRRARVDETQQPVARGARHRIVEAAEQRDHPGLLVGLRAAIGLGRVRGQPVGRRAQVGGMLEGNPGLVEHHLVAARGAQPQVVPALDHADRLAAFAPACLARHQEHAHARLGFVGARPYRQPAQRRNAGAVELVPRQAPAIAVAARDGGRQAAARGRAQVGFDAQRVDQRALLHRAGINTARRSASGQRLSSRTSARCCR